MNTLTLEQEPTIIDLTFRENSFVVHLADGRRLSVPYAWYPRLAYGTAAERRNWEIFGDGYAIHWPELDEDIAIDGLLAGNRSAESSRSLERWLENRKLVMIE